MDILHNVLVQDQAVSADGISNFDLPANPLSVIMLGLRPLNNTGTLANFQTYLGICSAVNRLTVLHNGQSVVSMRGQDIAALNYFRHGIMPNQANHDDTDDERRIVVLPVLMGKSAYNPNSCFPATRKGEFALELDLDIADTGYDGLRISVDTIELLGARPGEFERKVENGVTFSATGINDVDLPVGHLCRGVLAFGTTGFDGASPAPTLGRMKLQRDSLEAAYTAIDFEIAHCLTSLMGRQPAAFDLHTHRVDASSASTTEETSAAGPADIGSGTWRNYGWLELDPNHDDAFSLDLRDTSRFRLRCDAEAANAMRAIAVEKVAL